VPVSLPSEPCVRISRTRLSSWWFYLKQDLPITSCIAIDSNVDGHEPEFIIPLWDRKHKSRHVVGPESSRTSPTPFSPMSLTEFNPGRHSAVEGIRHVIVLSTSLHPLAPSVLPDFDATMGALTPGFLALRTGRLHWSPAHEHRPIGYPGLSASCVPPSDRSASNHLVLPAVALTRYPSASQASVSGLGFATWQQARRDTRPNRVHLRCGPDVRLPVLPTPPRGDAVPFGYKPESVSLKRTFTFLTNHTCRRTATGSASVSF
jgi:hypothetical protein